MLSPMSRGLKGKLATQGLVMEVKVAMLSPMSRGLKEFNHIGTVFVAIGLQCCPR